MIYSLDKNFNRKILKMGKFTTSMLTENNGVTYIEKIENQVNDSGQSSIVPYGSDELRYENILTIKSGTCTCCCK